MSFPEIEAQLKSLKKEIQEINQSIKSLVIQMQMIVNTFERTLKPKQKREYVPLEIKLPTNVVPGSDDERFIKRHQERILKETEELQMAQLEEMRKLKLKDKIEEQSD